MSTTSNNISVPYRGRVEDLFDPVYTPVRSNDLQDLLDNPFELCEVLIGHVQFSGHAPTGSVEILSSTLRGLFTWVAGHSVLEINQAGWNDFITTGDDPYQRALCCQVLHQLLDLLGVPSPHDAPLPNLAAVPNWVLPPVSTIATGQGRKPTRKLTPLELAVVRYAVLPQLKATTVHKGRHRPPRRDQFVAAVTVGAAGCLVSDRQLAAMHISHVTRIDDRLVLNDDGAGVFHPPVVLDAWTSARLTELLAHDVRTAAADDVRTPGFAVRHRNDRFDMPLLFGGHRAAESTAATNTMNAKITGVLTRTGLSRTGLTAMSVRLVGAATALSDGATEASVAARLGLFQRRGRADVEQLTRFLAQ